MTSPWYTPEEPPTREMTGSPPARGARPRPATAAPHLIIIPGLMLHPSDYAPLTSRFKSAEVIWCQEEPKNQGGWTFVEPYIEWVLERLGAKHGRARYVGRNAAASPATGLASRHKAEQQALVNEALNIEG